MKYYELTPEQAESIGRFKIDEQNYIDAKAGRLRNGNFAVSKIALKGLKKVSGVDFSKLKEKNVEFVLGEE